MNEPDTDIVYDIEEEGIRILARVRTDGATGWRIQMIEGDVRSAVELSYVDVSDMRLLARQLLYGMLDARQILRAALDWREACLLAGDVSNEAGWQIVGEKVRVLNDALDGWRAGVQVVGP